MTTNQDFHGLMDRLDRLGLPSDFIRGMLPSWWQDEAAIRGTGLLELKLMLARQFGIEPRSILEDDAEPTFSLPGAPVHEPV